MCDRVCTHARNYIHEPVVDPCSVPAKFVCVYVSSIMSIPHSLWVPMTLNGNRFNCPSSGNGIHGNHWKDDLNGSADIK